MKDDVIYIHYGSSEYIPEMISVSKSEIYSKPDKGLWASRCDDTSYTWKDWCESEGYDLCDFTKSFKFTVSDGARILEIHEIEDILPYVILDDYGFRPRYTKTSCTDRLDREKLYQDYDGMELFLTENYVEFHDGIFYTWDCDSICIWNHDVVEVVEGNNHEN